MSSLKKRMADLITTRDLLKMARRVECTCSVYYSQFDWYKCDCKRDKK